MKTIWKYKLSAQDVQNISMPIGAEILTVQTQHGKPCLWALVDPEAKLAVQPRTIEIFRTGHPIAEDMGTQRKYIATFQLFGAEQVYHAFEYTGV